MTKTNNIFLRENLLHSLERRQSLLTAIRWKTKQKVEKIIIKEPFYKFLDKVDKMKVSDKERSQIYDYIFCLLNRSADLKTNKKPSTANVTSIYWGGSFCYLTKIKSKKEIVDLVKFLDEENIPYTSITNMQSWKGIPNLKDLENFINFLKQNDLINDLSSITSMQNWKGIPNLKDLENFINFLKQNDLINDLSSITNMQKWKGIPNLKDLENFINFLRQNDLINDLSSITNMQMSKGIPNLKALENFINFLRQNNILDDLPSITSMQNWKGIPDLKILWELMSELWRKGLKLKDFSGKRLWVEATLKLVKTAYEQKRKLN